MLQKAQFTLSGSDGQLISGDYAYDDSQTIRHNVIFIHGFKGFKDWGTHNLVSGWFAGHGCRYIKFNLSHSGVTLQHPEDVTDLEAFAANTFSMELFDINAVIDYITVLFPDTPISLIGHSRGGGLAILSTRRDSRIRKLVTWSSIADFSSLWRKEQVQEWMSKGRIYVYNARTKEEMPLNVSLLEDFLEHREEYDILEAAARIGVPWLIIHGDDDVNVDFSVAEQLVKKKPDALLEKIRGANHVYGASHPYALDGLPPELLEVVKKTHDFITSP